MNRLLLAPSLVAAAALVGCSSTPVRQSPSVTPQQPIPTLTATAVYDYFVESETVEVDATGMSFGDAAKGLFRGAVDKAQEDPVAVAKAIGGMIDRYDAHTMVKELGPTLHAKVVPFLNGQGFALETDATRSGKLPEMGPGRTSYTYTEPGTASYPFTELPLFGPGSKGSIVEDLRTERDREAYASIHASFASDSDDVGDEAFCTLVIKILGKDGEMLFEGETNGSGVGAPGRHPKKVLEMAFDDALAQMRNPVMQES